MQSLYRTFERCFKPCFSLFGLAIQRRRFFRNQPIRNKKCLWLAFLFNGSGQNVQSLQRTFHGCFLPSCSSFGKAFSEEKIKCEKLTDDRQQITGHKVIASDSKSSRCLWQGELKTPPPVFTYLPFRHFLMSSSTAHLLLLIVFFPNLLDLNVFPFQRISYA